MRNRLALTLLMVFIIGVFATLSVYFGLFLIEVNEIEMDITIGDKVGFNTDTDALHFGTVYSGSESTRSLFIQNRNDFPIKISISNSGDFSDWLILEKNNFIISPNSNTSIGYVAKTPIDSGYGRYSGISTVTVKRNLW